MSNIRLCDTTFCDGLVAASSPIRNEMLLPVLAELNEVGLAAVEAFGPSVFESCVKVAEEDPWERLRKTREALTKTPLQMSFYGQNVMGNRIYPDDTVEYFVNKCVDNGVEIIRVTDPLNDLRNLESTIRAASHAGIRVIGGIAYTPDNSEVFALYAKQLEDMGVNAVSIQDDAGILPPYEAYQLVKALKSALLPTTEVHLHTRSVGGVSMATVLKAAEAGVDVIDTVLSPLSVPATLPSSESVIAALSDTPYAPELPLSAFSEATARMLTIRKALDGSIPTPSAAVTQFSDNFRFRLPGNILPSLSEILRDAKIENKRGEVLAESEKIREELGNPPLLSPIAEIVVAEAVLNVLSEKRYSMLTREFKMLVHGEYGRTPSEISPALRTAVCGNAEPIDCRPADKLEPLIERLRETVAPYSEQEEDILTYAMYGESAKMFFEARKIEKYHLDANADFERGIHSV